MPTQVLSQLDLPGIVTPTSWKLPRSLDEVDWMKCGKFLNRVEGAVQWWLGDWWAYGVEREYGEGMELAERVGIKYGTIANYAWVCGTFGFSRRRENLDFGHHQVIAGVEGIRNQDRWLDRAFREQLSVSRLRSAIGAANAAARTRAVEFNATALGKYSVIYADPPWSFDDPPIRSVTRAIENQYPTMAWDDIKALPVADIAHDDAILFLWTTVPLLMRTAEIITAWGFQYKANAVWVKDQIGMGFYFRNRHEHLLVCKRGEMPCPPVEARHDSVIESPRLGHSEKPVVAYDIIDLMYPDVRKIELFARTARRGWKSWGNQVEAVTTPVEGEPIVEAEAAE